MVNFRDIVSNYKNLKSFQQFCLYSGGDSTSLEFFEKKPFRFFQRFKYSSSFNLLRSGLFQGYHLSAKKLSANSYQSVRQSTKYSSKWLVVLGLSKQSNMK